MHPIALTGTGSGPGIREGGGSLPLWCSGSHRHVRARNRPAAPGCWVTDSIAGKARHRVRDGVGQPRRSRYGFVFGPAKTTP